MKKLFKTAAIGLAAVLTLSGCTMKMDMSFDIKNEDSITLDIFMGYDQELMDMMASQGDTSIEDMCGPDGDMMGLGDIAPDDIQVTVEPATVGEFTGCRITGTGTLAQFQENVENADAEGMGIFLEDGVWTFRMSGGDALADEGMDASQMAMVQNMIQFSFSVTFPGEVLTHSGDSTVSGRTVTWTNFADFTNLEATGRDGGGSANLLVPVILVVVVLAAGLGLVVLKKNSASVAAEPVAVDGNFGEDGQEEAPLNYIFDEE